MKRTIAVAVAAVCAVGVYVNSALAADKFGYVDLSRLFSEYTKTQTYDKTLTEKETAYNTDKEKKVNEIKQLQDKMNLLSDKEKEAKKGEFEGKLKDFQEWDRQRQVDLRKEQDEKMKEILKDIETTVKQYAEKEGYTMVFNDRVLVYQNKSMDITDQVVVILNKK